MRKIWLLCVCMGAVAWAQMQPAPSPAAPPNQSAAAPAKPAEVAEDAAVLTIYGVCPAGEKTAAATKTAAGKTTTGAAKSTAAKKPTDCKTVITRAEFEKMASGLAPTITPQLKRQLAAKLPQFMALSEAAKQKGLDKTPQYVETMKIVKMQILTQQLQRSVQEQADKVSDTEVEEYYKKNPEAYEQFSIDRIFVPRYKQVEPEKPSDEKLTDEQQKAKEAADQAKREEGEKQLTELAKTLQERAAKGEDFAALQKEAFEAAGMKMDSPTINLPKVRRTGLPPAHAAVFDLKVGEVSQVITDNGGSYIYKIKEKETLPLDDSLKTEIHNSLKSQHAKDMMDKYNNSFHADTNEAYFGPPGPAGMPGGRPGPPHMRMQMPPQGQGAPQAQPQSSASPSPAAPSSAKPATSSSPN
jgi:hypothetical protein